MKNILYLIPVALFLSSIFYGCSPTVYKTATDTINLNKEYREVSQDIFKLNNDITKAKSNIPIYEAKAQKLRTESMEALEVSRQQAEKATGGSLRQIKKAGKRADQAQDDAEDAKEAFERVEDEKEELADLMSALAKKQRRLEELDRQREAINRSTGGG